MSKECAVPAQTEILHVLVVEDNPGEQRLIREYLMDAEFSTFHLDVVTTLEDAISRLAGTAFDVVLLDLTLPDSAGINTFLRLNEHAPMTPIIVLSGLDDRELALAAMEHGAQDYLSKNRIEPDILERSIGYAISRQQAQAEIAHYSYMLEKVNTFSRFLSESLNQQDIFERLKNQIFALVPAIHTILISKFDAERQEFEPVETYHHQLEPELAAAPAAEAVEFAVPMIAQDSVVGMITLRSEDEAAFNKVNAEVLGIIANTAAVAIENAQLFGRTRQQVSRLSSLRVIDIAITSGSDLRNNLEVLLEQATVQLEADAVMVLLLNPITGLLETSVCSGFSTELFQNRVLHLGEGFAGKVAQENRFLQVPDFKQVDDNPIPEDYLDAEGFKAYFGAPLFAKHELQGVLEVFLRRTYQPDAEWVDYLEALAGQAAIAIDNAQLFKNLAESNAELMDAYEITIEGWSRAVELRDVETEGHTRRVTQLTMELVDRMGIPQDQKIHIRRGAILHDIGKIGVPDHVLLKPGKLSEEEWVIMKTHPVLAYEMLMKIEYLQPAIQIPYAHHEKWDGSGYPRGLAGEEIPLEARIFAIVDVYDALTSDRPYRDAWPEEKAIDHIKTQSGLHFDPVVVNVFLQFMEDRKKHQRDSLEPGTFETVPDAASEKHVVVVEDSPIIRERLKEIIDGIEGLSVVAEAEDTTEALRLVNYVTAGIYILDIRMPGGGGMEVLRLLKSLPEPPIVIVFTSFANERYRKRFADAGADFFFDKSTEMEALIQVLNELSVFDIVDI